MARYLSWIYSGNSSFFPTPYFLSPFLPMMLLSLSTQKHSPKVKYSFKEEYDYIIVGAGSAGSALAARLSEVPCVSVLLLEAGKSPPRLTEIPAIARSFVLTNLDWKFKTTPQKHTAAGHINRVVNWTGGKTLGGTSVLNSMLYVRANSRDYDGWAAMGAKGWSYDEVLPYFKKLEDNLDLNYLQNGYHSAGGPITVSRPQYNSIKKNIVSEAVLNEGYEFVDPNAEDQIGFYDYQASIRQGQRCSTAKAYLVPSENRTNLDILPNAMVKKVLIEKKQAVGVEFRFKGKIRRVRARREVILSAGTVNSAKLLMLSGVGPASELKKFKIPLVVDLPVGRNLQDHLLTYLLYKVDKNVPKFGEEIKKDENIREYIANRTGPLACEVGVYMISFLKNANNTDNIADYSVYIYDNSLINGLQLNYKPTVLAAFLPLANESLIVCGSHLLRPKSFGTVSLRSAKPYRSPFIDPNYLAHFQDKEDLLEGLKTCQKIMKNPAMKKINARPVDILVPGCEKLAAHEDQYLRCITRTIVVATNHQVGTAKMGDSSDPTTVVDPQLRVKEVKSLRVVDASIMPRIPSGNTNIPTIMVAEKASDLIKSTIECNRNFYERY